MSTLHFKLEIMFGVDFIVLFISGCQGINLNCKTESQSQPLVLARSQEKRLLPAVKCMELRALRRLAWTSECQKFQVVLPIVSHNRKGELHFRIEVSD